MDAFLNTLAGYFKPREKLWETPFDAARHFDPKTVNTPALEAIDDFLMRAYETPNFRGIISMPPQNGKSMRSSIAFPAWVLQQNPDTRIVLASYESQIAIRFSDALRRQIKDRGQAAGLEIGGKDTERNWQIKGHRGGVYAASVGGALTSRSADLLIIDDPVKGFAEASSPTYQSKTWEWWTGTALTRVQGGGSVIVILTRWHDDDLAGQLMRANPGVWDFLRIPAQADHRPELGETDPIGREPGEYMKSVQNFTTTEWEERKQQVGPKTWAALYQGVPSPDEGGIFPGEWARYDQPMWTEQPNGARIVPGIGRADHEIVQSWDFTFGDTKGSDFVVGQVWLRVGSQAYLLDMVRDRMNFPRMLEAVRALTAKWPQAQTTFVEAKASGSQVVDMLRESEPNAFIPVNPTESKVARANVVSPFAFSGNVILPDASLLPNVGEMLEELKLFPASSHDDTCLVAETLITTPNGDKPICDIKPGDIVLGASGWVHVLESGRTGTNKPVIAKAGLVGTANHPVYTSEQGFINLSEVKDGLHLWQSVPLQTAKEKSKSTQKAGACPATNAGGDAQNLDRRHLRKSKSASLKDIALSVLKKSQSMGKTYSVEVAGFPELWDELKQWSNTGSRLGVTLTPHMRHTENTSSLVVAGLNEAWGLFTGKCISGKWEKFLTASTSTTLMETPLTMNLKTSLLSHLKSIFKSPLRAGSSAAGLGKTKKQWLSTWIRFARSRKSGMGLRKVAAGTVSTPTAPSFADVYNLKTSDGTYFANGILVHNCDALTQAISQLLLYRIDNGAEETYELYDDFQISEY